uniref:CCC domain-containing protein n=1 Tax=Anopheles culicifacies TaxID=139723 RepID=A0A182MN73_9DIPT
MVAMVRFCHFSTLIKHSGVVFFDGQQHMRHPKSDTDRFRKQLPWIYHTCHRQLEGDCKVNAGTCGKYRVFKECCCDRETKLEGTFWFSCLQPLFQQQPQQSCLFNLIGRSITSTTTTTNAVYRFFRI